MDQKNSTFAICRVQMEAVEAFGPPTSIARPQCKAASQWGFYQINVLLMHDVRCVNAVQLGQKRGAIETPPKELGFIIIGRRDTRLPRDVRHTAYGRDTNIRVRRINVSALATGIGRSSRDMGA
eukprot:GHVU01033234.1.p1 GENE.GHVU01033234.1~~GHVU01033234.1.p1  ORF type:complete len:124 (-),score=6.33 GHVU01033234.1:97-468(-)